MYNYIYESEVNDMIIMESAIAMNNDYIECGHSLDKINVFAEASYKDYEINLKEAALKVLKENGTESDFDFLATEAANGYIERTRKAIAKIVEAIKKFIRTCQENLIKLVTNAKTALAINKAEDVCARNPGLRSKKVEYCDPAKRIGVLQQGLDKLRKKIAKIKAKGVATDADREEINDIADSTLRKAAVISTVAVVTLGTAIAIFKRTNSKTEVENAISMKSADECDINIDEDTAKNAETADILRTAASAVAKVRREIVRLTVSKSSTILAAIKGVFTGNKVKSENVEESTALEDLDMFNYVIESSVETDDGDIHEESATDMVEGLDLNAYFTELCDELFTATESAEESVEETTDVADNTEGEHVDEQPAESNDIVTESADDEDAGVNSQIYLEQLEHEIFGEDEEVAAESASTDESVEAAASLLDELESIL